MDLNSVVLYFFSLILGGVSIFFSYRLFSKTNFSFLSDYLMLIVLTNIWAFIIWIGPDLISHLLNQSGEHQSLLVKTLTVFKWFTFPVNIFHAYILLVFFSRLSSKPIQKKCKKGYFITSFFIMLYLLLVLLFEFKSGISNHFKILALIISYLFIVIEIFIFVYFLILSLRGEFKHAGICFKISIIGVTGYILYLLFSSGYTLFSGIGIQYNYTITLISFYSIFCIPLVLLYLHFISQNKFFHKKKITRTDLLTILESSQLTPREKEIACLIFNGLTNQEIEEKLFLSLQTVKNYISSIYRKLQVKSRLDFIRFVRSRIEFM